MTELKAGVASAIQAIREHFRHCDVKVLPSAGGGANVIIEDVPLGPPYNQAKTWVGFYLSDACPYDDTYPFYVTGSLSRIDGTALLSPLYINQRFPADGSSTETRDAVMVSRRQRNRGSFAYESPLLKLKTVLKWMVQQ
ncbi:hypothetical protein ACTJKE_06505 [Ensifer sp. 22521]|uniref:hypothetical protein n=1 Tax=Ensifer sp. 22521 TaxID=3453935 RepID=UPI003F871633